MVLARVDPSRTAALMSRAAEYAESRLVCGVHYPSDIEAGHAVAAAVVAELDGNANFRADLERAREELAAQRR
jgi:acid phosphatase (class A)